VKYVHRPWPILSHDRSRAPRDCWHPSAPGRPRTSAPRAPAGSLRPETAAPLGTCVETTQRFSPQRGNYGLAVAGTDGAEQRGSAMLWRRYQAAVRICLTTAAHWRASG
jgi:hypothetical protein